MQSVARSWLSTHVAARHSRAQRAAYIAGVLRAEESEEMELQRLKAKYHRQCTVTPGQAATRAAALSQRLETERHAEAEQRRRICSQEGQDFERLLRGWQQLPYSVPAQRSLWRTQKAEKSDAGRMDEEFWEFPLGLRTPPPNSAYAWHSGMPYDEAET